MRRRTWVLGLTVVLLASGATLGASLSVAWSSWIQLDLQPFALGVFESSVEVGYSISGWDLSSTALLDETGLWNVYFDADGALGGFAIRSIADFDAAPTELRAWLSSVSTGLAGVNFYALFMVDDLAPVGMIGGPWFGSGATLGAIWKGGGLSIWAQTQFNMTDSSRYVYLYGLDWLMDHFVFTECGTWYKPSGYVDVQTDSCSMCWSGVSLYVEFSLGCADLLAQVSFTAEDGFDHILLELLNVDLGLTWMNVEWVDLWYTVESKSVNVVFDVSIADNLCFTPYLALNGSGVSIDGIELKAIAFECAWDAFTFKAGHLFDEDGWQEYLNYTYYDYGWTWDGELSYLNPCKVPDGYDEYFGLEVRGDACCGGEYGLSTFVWFDTGKSAGIFDWVETRVILRTALSANLDLRFGMSVTEAGAGWIGVGFDMHW